MKPPLRRRGASWRATSSSYALFGLLALVGCDRASLPSQVLAIAPPRPDTVSAPRVDTVATTDTVTAAAPTDTAIAQSSPDDADVTELTAQGAELPRVQVDVRYPAPRRVVRLAAGGDLQAAIDSAAPGDELLLPRGAVYVGNYSLPDKGASDEWIVIRTDVSDAELGPPGTRLTPSRAAALRLASIVSPNATSAVVTALGAHHYRFTGVEITVLESVGDINALVRFGESSIEQRSDVTTAHHLVVDRSYLHGTPTLQLRRCLMLNSATSAVVDSWLGDCHSNVSDSQAIVGWNGPGPYLIQNDHLEAGHEVVMFGGGGVTRPDVSPADVTIRGNHFTRPLAWRGVWQVKNLLETKHVRRMLVEGNVFENNWVDAQAGFAFVLKSENQNWDTPWTQSTDITIRYNRVRRTGSGWNLAANPSGAPAIPAGRITITDNVLEDVNVAPFDGDGHTLQLLGGLADVVFAHNTVVSANGGSASMVVFGALPGVERLALHSNVLTNGAYGVKGSGAASGRASLALFAPKALFARNVVVGAGNASAYPGGNWFVSALSDVGFADLAQRDYRLVAPAFRGRSLDERDVGADIERVDAATRGAVVLP